jgi:hypothetical protein
MRKSPTDMNAAVSRKRSISRLSTFATILVIGVISAPLVIECAVLYHAKWSAILGKSTNARTPILDSIQRAWLSIYEELSLHAAYFIRRFLNQPSVMLPTAAIALAVGMVVLMRSRHNSF